MPKISLKDIGIRIGSRKPIAPAAKTLAPKISKPPKAEPKATAPKSPDAPKAKTQGRFYNTLSLLGTMLAALRNKDEMLLMQAEADYLEGFRDDLASYGMDFPAAEYGELRHYAHLGKWPQAFQNLKKFSDSFGPRLREALMKDNSVKAEIVSLANSFLAMIAVRDPARMGQLENAAISKFKYLGNPSLNSLWRANINVQEADQESEMDELEDIVKAFKGKIVGNTPRERYTLSFSEREKLRKSDPEMNARYNKAYNGAIKKYRAVLRNYVLDHGDKPQPIAKTREYMESNGFYLHDLPHELDRLYIGSDGFYRTSSGLKIIQRPLPGAIIGDFNPDYNPDADNAYVFKYRTDEGNWGHAYTEAYKKDAKVAKSEGYDSQAGILELMKSVPPKRPIWLKDFEDKDERRRICALLTDISYLACTRIGSPAGFTKGVGTTYGLSTLLRKHCILTATTMTFAYKGKDGKDQRHEFRASNKDEKRIINAVRPLLVGKKPNDSIFTESDGRNVTAAHVNAYMKSIGLGMTSHYMRSIRGTKLMQALLEKYKKKDLQGMAPTQVEALFKTEALEVGKLLGHVSGGKPTAATAINNYIDPTFAQHWFKDNGLRVPLWLKKMSTNLD